MYIPSAYLMQSSGKDKDVSLPSRLWYLPFPGIQRSSCQSFDDNIMGPPPYLFAGEISQRQKVPSTFPQILGCRTIESWRNQTKEPSILPSIIGVMGSVCEFLGVTHSPIHFHPGQINRTHPCRDQMR